MKSFPRPAKVLVVDDKPGNLLALVAVLENEYEIVAANSGPEAIEMLRARPDVDVVLLDVQMPGMDGYETAAQIKQLAGCQDLPIVFISAVFTEDPHVKRGYEAGGMDYFSKPFDPDILKRKLGVYATFRMRSEVLRQREQQLHESEALLRAGRKLSAVLESLPIGVLIADAQGVVYQTTEEVSRILKSTGATESDAYGEIIGWWDGDGRMLKEENGPLARAVRHGETTHSERLRIRCLDGTEKTIVASASPLHHFDGRIAGAVVLLQDLTETTKIEEDLEERVTRLVGVGMELEESVRPRAAS